jgi:formamidopyrimidine-DNA glycosylase
MPELPEVETVCKGLTVLTNKTICKVFRSNKKLRIDSKLNFSSLISTKIFSVSRKARYILINLDFERTLIVHLGMTGRITYQKDYQQKKHDHFFLKFDDETYLVFNDTRRFGFVDLIENDDLKNYPSFVKLGVDPLTENFNLNYFYNKINKKNTNIKTAIMDNEIVVGVGNIYANESLFDAKISPLRLASSLKKVEIKKLINSIKKILQNAIKLGGSSISDYVNSQGNKGSFQNSFKIYGRNNENCLICRNLIKKITQLGRSTFYCKNCQG